MMARPRPKVSVYPRPVSPLCAESYYIEPQNVIYSTVCPSWDDNASTRAAKRRRIEKLGEQYLRGDGLHILSAGLKGPFGDGWKNPYTKRERQVQRAVVEIPETAGKPIKKLSPKDDWAKAKSRKSEEWLRKKSAYSGIELAEQISPTPPCAKFVDLNDVHLARKNVPPQRDELHEASGRTRSGPAKSKLEDRLVSDQCNAHPVSERPLPTWNPEPRAQVSDNAPPERRAWVSYATIADRVGFAALKSKRRTLQVAPASTMLSPFEYRRVLDGVQKPENLEEVAGPSQHQTGQVAAKVEKTSRLSAASNGRTTIDMPEMVDGRRNETDIVSGKATASQTITMSASVAGLALSTEISRASIANLPSAQPQSLAVSVPSANDLVIYERVIEPPREPLNLFEPPETDMKFSEAKILQPNEQVDSSDSLAMSKASWTPQAKNKADFGSYQTRLAQDVAGGHSSMNTEVMLADMSPFVFSSIKKTNMEVHPRETPITATKRKPAQASKRTSFAQAKRVSSDSSQGSLKMILKVSKGCSSTSAGKENTLIRFGDEETDMPSPDMFIGPENESLVPASSPKRLKSALKPSGPPMSQMPFPLTKGSTSTGVDGGQNILRAEDNMFDLDGAIDDLGSYLGTWDAEKEASNLGIET